MNENLPNLWLGRVIKNSALGSALLGQVVYCYYKQNEQVRGIDLMRSILVLPMLFHSPTVTAIHAMNLKSGLVKAVLEKKIILNGIEKRIADSLPTTFQSIQMGNDTKLFRVDKFEDNFQLIPIHSKFPIQVSSQQEKIRHMFAAAKRLGDWFHLDSVSLYKILQIRGQL
jgi:hypothetical protein